MAMAWHGAGVSHHQQQHPDKLYHYTDTNGKNQIEATRKILQSSNVGRNVDAFYGNGVYLTTIPPNKSTQEILGNNWDGAVNTLRALAAKTEWCFELDLQILGWQFQNNLAFLEKVGNQTGRDVWIYRGQHINLPYGLRAGRRNVH